MPWEPWQGLLLPDAFLAQEPLSTPTAPSLAPHKVLQRPLWPCERGEPCTLCCLTALRKGPLRGVTQSLPWKSQDTSSLLMTGEPLPHPQGSQCPHSPLCILLWRWHSPYIFEHTDSLIRKQSVMYTSTSPPTQKQVHPRFGVWVLLTCPSRSPITDLEPSLLQKGKISFKRQLVH